MSRYLTRARAGLGRTPRPLALLLVVVAVVGVCWALTEPAWLAPDEPSHYAYAESLAARLSLPSGTDRSALSSDQIAAEIASGGNRTNTFSQVAKGSWDPAADAAYRRIAGRLSKTDGGGSDSADSNPPLYYLYADLGYWAAWGGNAYDRLYAMRLASVLLLLATTVGACARRSWVFSRCRHSSPRWSTPTR
jgi:hypothetical protein